MFELSKKRICSDEFLMRLLCWHNILLRGLSTAEWITRIELYAHQKDYRTSRRVAWVADTIFIERFTKKRKNLWRTLLWQNLVCLRPSWVSLIENKMDNPPNTSHKTASIYTRIIGLKRREHPLVSVWYTLCIVKNTFYLKLWQESCEAFVSNKAQ